MSENKVYRSSFYEQRKIMKLPPSAKFILFLLKLKGPMNRKKIIQESLMPDRTIGFALKLLLDKGLIKKEDPNSTSKSSSKGKRKYRKQDRRITNYSLASIILPYEVVES
ncbi:MAG: hypothetical protein ACFFD2_18735 [Promethearchaeota archaeon]